MNGVAIVAIPPQDDYVWKISTEKVPHMTILHFGDTMSDSDIVHVTNFLDHLVQTSMSRFGMSVDHRGVLGPEDADVVFFDDDSAKRVAPWRADMLRDDTILEAYNSAPQYPQWTPHLTLGYPTDPAKPDNREYPGIHWVNFDKIALWTGDYAGVEFQLQENGALAMSETITLAGVTLQHKKTAPAAASKFSTTPWGNYKESDYSLEQWISACLISPAKPSQSKNDYKLPVKEPDGTLNENAIAAAAGVLSGARGGVQATSEQKAAAKKKLQGYYHQMGKTAPWKPKKVTHEDKPPLDEVLAHHGVKGMKWGVRKDGSVSSTTTRTSRLRRPATDVTAKQKPGQFVRTSGGKRQTASEDAVRIAATRQLAKKSTTDTLSNKQLQDAVTRMNLEQQYHSLVKKTNRQTRGQRFVTKLVGGEKVLDKNGNPLPGSSPSFATQAASMVGEALKKSAGG